MLDLAKSFILLIVVLLAYMSLGALVLRAVKEELRLSLMLPAGFFLYHLLFSLVALPCILTRQTLTTLIWVWLPAIGVILIASLLTGRHTLTDFGRRELASLRGRLKTPSSVILPILAVLSAGFVLYLSICSYYVGWDTAFYVRTTLNAVQNDSMFTLDAASGQTAAFISLRYALSPFYMNSAIASRLLHLHPLLVQNLVDGSVCVILAFTVIYRIGLFLSRENRQTACLAVVFAAVLHIGHASLFSASEFLILRSYEAKAYCANVILPFIFLNMVCLWKEPDKSSRWWLLLLSMAASNAVSMSALFTVPALVAACSFIWLLTRQWRFLRNVLLCMLPNLLYIGAYLLEYSGLLKIPVI